MKDSVIPIEVNFSDAVFEKKVKIIYTLYSQNDKIDGLGYQKREMEV